VPRWNPNTPSQLRAILGQLKDSDSFFKIKQKTVFLLNCSFQKTVKTCFSPPKSIQIESQEGCFNSIFIGRLIRNLSGHLNHFFLCIKIGRGVNLGVRNRFERSGQREFVRKYFRTSSSWVCTDYGVISL